MNVIQKYSSITCAKFLGDSDPPGQSKWCNSPNVTHVTTGDPSILDDIQAGRDTLILYNQIGYYYCSVHAPDNAVPITMVDFRAVLSECIRYVQRMNYVQDAAVIRGILYHALMR